MPSRPTVTGCLALVMRFHRSRVTRTRKPKGVRTSKRSSGSDSTWPFYTSSLVPSCDEQRVAAILRSAQRFAFTCGRLGSSPRPLVQRVLAAALYIFESDSSTFTECRPRLGNATQERRMMLKAILEPVVFRSESDQHACRTAVPSDHDFFLFRQAEVLRQIIFDFSESHRPELACLLRRSRLALRLSR